MSFDLNTPELWLDLALHPTFEGMPFEKAWYDGDLDVDLLRLRRVCLFLTQTIPELTVELVVLDDCTFFANVGYEGDVCCELYPSVTSVGKPCLFLAFSTLPNTELRVLTEKEAEEVIRAYIRKEDISVFDRIE